MGAHSTMEITREDALAEMMRHLNSSTDEELANALFSLVGDRRLYNFQIVNNYEDSDWSIKYEPGIF